MAHKGYTLNYFIEFFQNTKPNQWVCGAALEHGKGGKETRCAIGFAGAYEAEPIIDEDTGEVIDYECAVATTPRREAALLKFLPAVEINDSNVKGDTYYKLGKTPRARILKALKLRKKFGANWEDNL